MAQFHAEAREELIAEYVERFNIAPTQDLLVVRELDGRRQFDALRWGLVPPWAESPDKGPVLFNAQSETVAQKPTFRSIIKTRRCLIPADGFYEWEKVGTKKQPHYFGVDGFKPFAFAGLWQTWNKSDPPLHSCVILTTRANELLGKLHDRMPVILAPNDYDVWLDPAREDPASLEYLYEPYPAAEMSSYRVSTRVNNARHEGRDLITPLDRDDSQPTLPFEDDDAVQNSR